MFFVLVHYYSFTVPVVSDVRIDMLQSKFIFVFLLIGHTVIGYATVAKSPEPNLSIVIQTTLTNSVINSTVFPIDILHTSNKMVQEFKKVQSATAKLLQLPALPTLTAANIFSLLTVVHDVFDVIIATARGLEHKLNGIIGFIDVPVINIQIALQSLIQTIVVNVVLASDTRNATQTNINYALLGVVDGIQMLLDTSYRLLSGIVTLPRNDLAKSMFCLEGIVQTILSITENVLVSLRDLLWNFKIDIRDHFFMPKLEMALTNSLNKLARNVSHPVTSIVKVSLEPTLLAIIAKLKGNIGSVSESSLKLIKDISLPIDGLLATITDTQKIAARTLVTINSITRNLPSSMMSVSNRIKSLPGNTLGLQSTFSVALSNAIASFHSLTFFLTRITTYAFSAPKQNTQQLLSDTRIILLLLATNTQTLVDTATQAISQSLIHSLRSKKMRVLQASLKESTMKITFLLENIIKVHLRAMQTLLSGVSQGVRSVLLEYSEALVAVAVNMKHLIGDLGNGIEDVLTGAAGNVSKTTILNDAVKGIKMVVDNADNLRIFVRNAFRIIESYA